MTFHELTLDKGVATEAGERAMELVYEALTGKCWHRWEHGEVEMIQPEYLKEPDAMPLLCGKCAANRIFNSNPALLTSLDAWIPLWERMLFSQRRNYGKAMEDIAGFTASATNFVQVLLLRPHHHLEAALRTLEVECPTCYGTKERPCCNCDLKSPGCNGDNCNCTCTNGKIPLWDIWEAGNDR